MENIISNIVKKNDGNVKITLNKVKPQSLEQKGQVILTGLNLKNLENLKLLEKSGKSNNFKGIYQFDEMYKNLLSNTDNSKKLRNFMRKNKFARANNFLLLIQNKSITLNQIITELSYYKTYYKENTFNLSSLSTSKKDNEVRLFTSYLNFLQTLLKNNKLEFKNIKIKKIEIIENKLKELLKIS